MKRPKAPLRKLSVKQSLQHRTFWHIFLMMMFSMAFVDFMKPQLKYYGTSKFDDDSFLTAVGMTAFISSSAAKFGWGVVQDYLGFIKVYMITLVLQGVLCFSIDSVSSTRVMFIIWMILVFVCEGAHFVIFPAVSSAIYGSK
jgi:sugar phosphate permease